MRKIGKDKTDLRPQADWAESAEKQLEPNQGQRYPYLPKTMSLYWPRLKTMDTEKSASIQTILSARHCLSRRKALPKRPGRKTEPLTNKGLIPGQTKRSIAKCQNTTTCKLYYSLNTGTICHPPPLCARQCHSACIGQQSHLSPTICSLVGRTHQLLPQHPCTPLSCRASIQDTWDIS